MLGLDKTLSAFPDCFIFAESFFSKNSFASDGVILCFFKNDIKYAGLYETAGQLIRIYDTLQDSVDAQSTTDPSAIQRQGTDVSSNDPRLNLPNTPDNLV